MSPSLSLFFLLYPNLSPHSFIDGITRLGTAPTVVAMTSSHLGCC